MNCSTFRHWSWLQPEAGILCIGVLRLWSYKLTFVFLANNWNVPIWELANSGGVFAICLMKQCSAVWPCRLSCMLASQPASSNVSISSSELRRFVMDKCNADSPLTLRTFTSQPALHSALQHEINKAAVI